MRSFEPDWRALFPEVHSAMGVSTPGARCLQASMGVLPGSLHVEGSQRLWFLSHVSCMVSSLRELWQWHIP